MEINEKVNGINRYDYLKYEYFVLKCYHEKDPIFCVCDRETFYYLNCNHNSMTIRSLVNANICKLEIVKYAYTNEPIPILCSSKTEQKEDSSVYEIFAGDKINKSNLQKDKIKFAFLDKTADELLLTFRLVSAHTDLQEALTDFIKIIEERKKISYTLKDYEIIK